jgi:hypothetical protein
LSPAVSVAVWLLPFSCAISKTEIITWHSTTSTHQHSTPLRTHSSKGTRHSIRCNSQWLQGTPRRSSRRTPKHLRRTSPSTSRQSSEYPNVPKWTPRRQSWAASDLCVRTAIVALLLELQPVDPKFSYFARFTIAPQPGNPPNTVQYRCAVPWYCKQVNQAHGFTQVELYGAMHLRSKTRSFLKVLLCLYRVQWTSHAQFYHSLL